LIKLKINSSKACSGQFIIETMYIEIKHFHSIIAYLSLALLIFAIVFTVYGWLSKKPFTNNNKIIALIGLAAIHTQVLFGLILYFLSPLGLSNFSGAAMKDATSRLYMLEHPFVMIIAVVLITIGYSKANRLVDDVSKYKKIVIFYSIGLVLILSRIPWSVWF